MSGGWLAASGMGRDRHEATPPLKVFVAFDNGEVHGYRGHSWEKLHPAGTLPELFDAPVFPPVRAEE